MIFDNDSGTSKTQPKLRLRSMYAENPEDSLLFQWENDQLHLMITPYAQRVDHCLLEDLRNRKSVPVFLSALTMELFENQTFMG